VVLAMLVQLHWSRFAVLFSEESNILALTQLFVVHLAPALLPLWSAMGYILWPKPAPLPKLMLNAASFKLFLQQFRCGDLEGLCSGVEEST